MKMKVTPLVVAILGTVPKGLEKRLRELEREVKIETIKTTELLKSGWILRRVLEIWGDMLLNNAIIIGLKWAFKNPLNN